MVKAPIIPNTLDQSQWKTKSSLNNTKTINNKMARNWREKKQKYWPEEEKEIRTKIYSLEFYGEKKQKRLRDLEKGWRKTKVDKFFEGSRGREPILHTAHHMPLQPKGSTCLSCLTWCCHQESSLSAAAAAGHLRPLCYCTKHCIRIILLHHARALMKDILLLPSFLQRKKPSLRKLG